MRQLFDASGADAPEMAFRKPSEGPVAKERRAAATSAEMVTAPNCVQKTAMARSLMCSFNIFDQNRIMAPYAVYTIVVSWYRYAV